MKKGILLGLVITLGILLGNSLKAQQYSSVTTFPPLTNAFFLFGGPPGGVSFNLRAENHTLVIDSLYDAFLNTKQQSVTIWYNTDSINGQPTINTANGWIKLGTVAAKADAYNVLTLIPLGINVKIPTGKTYGFFIESSGVGMHSYGSGIYSYISDGKLTINTAYACGFGGTSPNPSLQGYQFTGKVVYHEFYKNDAGISEILSPKLPSCSNIDSLVKVELTNYGADVLSNAEIHWSVNGTIQNTTSWTGSLPQKATGNVSLGKYGFSNGDILKIWSEMPNGVLDSVASNDTIMRTIHLGLNGIYKLGGVGSDYNNFTEAITDLNKFGVCGAVTFNVYDTTFNEQLTLGDIPGGSSKSTVTFVGDSLKMPILKTTNAADSNNYTVYFDGASHIKFKQIKIWNTSTGNYRRVIDLGKNSNHIIIDSCSIMGDSTPTSASDDYALIYANNTQDSNITLSNNILKGGSFSIYLNGKDAQTPTLGFTIKNNQLSDLYSTAIEINNLSNLQISNNYITTVSLYSSGYGIKIDFCNNISINNNKIGNDGYTLWPYYGISVSSPNRYGSSQDTSNIFNNFIQVGDSTASNTRLGLYLTTPYKAINIYNNNINVFSVSLNNKGLYVNNPGNATVSNIYNNILNVQDGYAYYQKGSLATKVDYNVLYNNRSSQQDLAYIDGKGYATIKDVQADGYQKHSISIDPSYRTYRDLYPCQMSLVNAGYNFNNLKYGIDGLNRIASSPTIGATLKMFNPAFSNFLGNDTILCPGDTIELGYSYPKGVFQWSTGDSSSSIQVTKPGTYTLAARTTCGEGLAEIKIKDGVPDASFTDSVSFLTVAFKSQSGFSDYKWSFGDGDSAFIQNPIHIFPGAGNYTVNLKVENSCGVDTNSKKILLTPLGIDKLSGSNMRVQPNPNNGHFRLVLNNFGGKNIDVEILNIQGKIVYENSFIIQSDLESEPIYLKKPSGIYILKLKTAKDIFIQKIILN